MSSFPESKSITRNKDLELKLDQWIHNSYLYGKEKAEKVHQKLVSDPLGKGPKRNNPCRKHFRK